MKNRVGETNINNQGLKMTIIEYRGANDIDVKFEDGTIIKNKTYSNFIKRNIKNQNYKHSSITDKIGEIRYNNQGEKMTIIKYYSYNNIDIQFEDGVISYNKCYGHFKKGLIKHPIKYEDSIAHYIEVELGLNLDYIWNWKKNKVNPHEIYKNSRNKIWVYCLEKDYHNDNGGYEVLCSNFTSLESRCPYCNSKKVHYKDSLAYNYPNIAKMIAIEENNLTFDDCYDIACHSSKKFYFKCLDCNIISNKRKSLDSVIRQGHSCQYCSDGFSIPNKFMSNLLNQLNINFKSEYSPYYFRKNQHVDFLLTDYNIIVEMDGNYGNHTKEYDYWRDFLNMKYGGYKTIRIDLTNDKMYKKDLFNYIKEQIVKSELSNLFNLNNINWNHIWIMCQKSNTVKAWELWNNGMYSTYEISKVLNVHQSTIIKYLKIGKNHNKCNYPNKRKE